MIKHTWGLSKLYRMMEVVNKMEGDPLGEERSQRRNKTAPSMDIRLTEGSLIGITEFRYNLAHSLDTSLIDMHGSRVCYVVFMHGSCV